MRIIAGQFRGRRLASSKSRGTRPSTERLREAVFNILGDWIKDKRVLDLFAGTGAMGLEALSRGAQYATFVERNRLALSYLTRNVENLGVEACSDILAAEAGKALHILKDRDPFDLIYMDPPYGQPPERLHQLLSVMERNRLLAPKGRLFLEESIAHKDFPVSGALELKQVRRYGRTHLWEIQWRVS